MLTVSETGMSLGSQPCNIVENHQHKNGNSLGPQPSNHVDKPSIVCQRVMLPTNETGNSHGSQPCNHVDKQSLCPQHTMLPTSETGISLGSQPSKNSSISLCSLTIVSSPKTISFCNSNVLLLGMSYSQVPK